MEKSNKRFVCILFILLALLFTGNPPVWSANITALSNPVKSDPGSNRGIPAIELPMPASEQAKSYLGLSGTGNFKIGQIKAQVLIIEVFSFYCPHCQRSASQVNELYQKIQERPDMKEKIKMIGIGVGNSIYEVDSYRKRYNVPFPLFPDVSTDFSLQLGVRGTPTFIGLKVNSKGVQEHFYFLEGGFQDTQQFLTEIIKLSGLK
jgi:thiol-disulfide isomerase/thioredoxin